MSANEYARCPRCILRAKVARANAVDSVARMYGKVSPAEYEAARAAVPDTRDALLEYDFREDYEILVGHDGSNSVVVDFGGMCEKCGLEVSFTYRHVIEGLDA